MAEHNDIPPLVRPIVPDPQSSLSQRPQHVRRPRMWPLWFFATLLFAALASLAAYGWWYSQQLEQRLETLQGELSNLVARQAGERESSRQHNGEVSRLAARFDRFESEQGRYSEDIEARLASVTDELDTVSARTQRHIADAEHEESMSESFGSRFSAVQSSLDALEKSGKEGRETLSAELQAQQQNLSTLQSSVDERLGSVMDSVSGHQKQQGKMTERIDAVEEKLAEHAAWQKEQREQLEQYGRMAQRIDELETRLDQGLLGNENDAQRLDELVQQVRELRQTQLVINAQLEGMAQ